MKGRMRSREIVLCSDIIFNFQLKHLKFKSSTHSLTIIQLTSLKAKFSWCCKGKNNVSVGIYFSSSAPALQREISRMLLSSSCLRCAMQVAKVKSITLEHSLSLWMRSEHPSIINLRLKSLRWQYLSARMNTSLKVDCLSESFCTNDEWLNVERGKFWLLLHWNSELADSCCWQEIDS